MMILYARGMKFSIPAVKIAAKKTHPASSFVGGAPLKRGFLNDYLTHPFLFPMRV